MEKIVELDLLDADSFFETYNRKKVSKDLINYLVNECYNLKKNDKIKIVINDSMKENVNCVKLIKAGLKNEYDICYKRHQRISVKQLIYLVLGIAVLFMSKVVIGEVFKEVILICGWVLIWSMFELEIFTDVDSKKRRRILKKLFESEFVENELPKE